LPGLSIAAVGDIMMGTDYPENILPDDDGLSFLQDVTPILSSVDIAFGNVEGVLMDGGEPVKLCKSSTACFVFRSPTRYATYLREAGFDVVSLANNHAQDFGDPGRESTMQALDAVGILHSGREGDVAEWTVKGRRVAMIAFAPNVGSHQLNDLPRARELVSALATRHDVVIVSFHGGAEGGKVLHVTRQTEIFLNENRGNVHAFSHAVVDAGAHIVFGHGPHVPRAIEVYKRAFIAYSLGNFCTYYGISVTGVRGLAAILIVRVDDDGRFLEGRIEPTIQIRPAGPTRDPLSQAVEELRWRTEQSFPWGDLSITRDGVLNRN
jgi:poly-gamma-glutamate capsule biosynthesis protein CapA/YwtB (metallophosphatase superfamily)